jgi:integrase/recombinase XerD
MIPATTSAILDLRRQKKDGTYPVKVRVTFERKQKYYLTPFDLTKHHFDKLMFAKRLSEEEKKEKGRIVDFEVKGRDIISGLKKFDWHSFEKKFYNKRVNNSLSGAFIDYAKTFRDSGQIGTAVAYDCARSSLDKFQPGANLADVTPEFLSKYQEWMLTNGKSVTTVSIYIRTLRALINNAITEGNFQKESYPFGRRIFDIPKERNLKKALKLSDIEMIFNYDAQGNKAREMAKDYWIFIYLCNGMNVKDLCLLKYENIKGDTIEFKRAKTSRTKRTVESIRVVLSDTVKTLIDKWGNKSKAPDHYIFPVLKSGLTPVRVRQLVQQLTAVINAHMKIIGAELELPLNPTTYVARHSFATILKRSGVSTEYIGESLGHSDIRTTQNYLGSFEDDHKKEVVKALTAFKTPKLVSE